MYTKILILFVSGLCAILFSHPGITSETPGFTTHNTQFWVGETGPTGPLFTGPHQYPFICTTFDNGLGQPLVDNQLGIGNAVFPEINGIPDFTADPIGYSQYCGIKTRVDYFYYSTMVNNFLPLVDPDNVPDDVQKIVINNGPVNFVVRLERGTINRFLYSIAMLAPFKESLDKPQLLNNAAWNHKLVYKFQGGVAIGHWQGSFSLSQSHSLHYESLKRGYAVAYSTGTKTSTHYNLKLAEETALMVKSHFKKTYGKPLYTVGIGASGGAIQQYVIGQNNRHIIDAAIPQMSYPDMITQTIHVGDCDLLERYFDMEYLLNPLSRWSNWLERELIEGLAGSNIAIQDPWSASPYAPMPGSNECINGWRGEVQSVFNPQWTNLAYYQALQLYRYPDEVIANIKWTHFNDLGNIYPQDENGFAYSPWDNVGVQYGLQALLNKDISIQEFLDINACVGSWKPPQDMVLGNYPWNPDAEPASFDPWDQLNMNLNPLCKFGLPAPRSEGNLLAINAAQQSGHVFTGDLDIPIIDIRWYLEPVLDMHHSQGSFSTRARIIKQKGHAHNQIIWFTECSNLDPVYLDGDCAYEPTGDALDVIDEWLSNKHYRHSHKKNIKPASAVDACFNGDGSLLYSGEDAWDGILNHKPMGTCSNAFPIYSTSRRVAGGPINGDIFKCTLKILNNAVTDGTYGDITFDQNELNLLKTIFPNGVCDYDLTNANK